MFIYFTEEDNDFSHLIPVQFERLSLLMSGEAKRNYLPEYNGDRVDPTFFENMQYIVNTNNESDYETLLTYKTYSLQFPIIAIPLCELFSQKLANQLSFEGAFRRDGVTISSTGTHSAWYMHIVLIRSD